MWFLSSRRPKSMASSQATDRPFVLGIRQLPSQWVRQELPIGLTESEALRHVRRLARMRSRRCSLQTPSGRVFWINAAGRLVGSSRRWS
jgi:hypothetical protein